ncbi:MAG: 2-hydroxyacid dehydrogenase [Ottowia sp.]|uniref:2-hydroxyacid dehydrogenase n=1 Tax=Ottowia sp. TaxID=1898956 RepID=UPI003C796F75
MPRQRLLQIGPLPEGLQSRLEERYHLHPLWLEGDRESFLAAATPFDGAVTMSRHACDEAVMKAMSGRVIACFGVGTERLDLSAAQRFSVHVSNTPDVLTECVADLAWGLILATARQIPQAHAFVRSGQWHQRAFGLGTRVHGKRLGIVGLGRIGHAIWRRSAGFGMPMRYHGNAPKAGIPGYEPDLVALAQWSDFLLLSCQGGPETHHLVNRTVLDALGPGGFLINIARGSVVDETALAQALSHGTLGGAGLDVYASEPGISAFLLEYQHVVTLPHMAASTHETRQAMEELVIDNLESYFQSGRLLTPVP